MALFFLTFALFATSIGYNFVDLDDGGYVTDNLILDRGLTWEGVRNAFTTLNLNTTMYMPLLWVSYMADITLAGGGLPPNPAVFHLVNVLLHALNAVLLYALLLAVRRRPWVALFCAAVWAWHPLRVESVAWITERKDVLSGMFGLLAMLAWLGARRDEASGHPPRPRTVRVALWVVSGLCFACGLLVKSALLPLAPALWLLEVEPLRHIPLSGAPRNVARAILRSLPAILPFFLLAVAAVAGTIWTAHLSGGIAAVPGMERLVSIPVNLVHYLRVTFLPWGLTVLAPDPALTPWTVAGASILLAALATELWLMRRAAPLAGVGMAWFFLFLAPVCGIIPVPNNAVADRFTYLPALGLSLAVLAIWPAWKPATAAGSRRAHAAAIAGLVALLAVLAVLSLRQLSFWRNTSTLYARTERFSPNHPLVLNYQAAYAIRERGDFAAARDITLRAMEMYPRAPQLSTQMASYLATLEGPEAALDFLRAHPPSDIAGQQGAWHWKYADFSLRAGDAPTAIFHTRRAMETITPQDSLQMNLRYLLFAAAYEAGDRDTLRAAAADLPELFHGRTTFALGDLLVHYIAQWMIYERADAIRFFRKLAAAEPNRPDLLNNIAWILATAKYSPAEPGEATAYARAAIHAAGERGDDPALLDTLAAALANEGDFDAAVATLRRAIDALPADAPSRNAMLERLALYQAHQPYRKEITARAL